MYNDDFRKINDYKKKNAYALDDVEDYLSNPINVFLLARRVTIEWGDLVYIMTKDVSQGNFLCSIRKT